MPNISDVSDFLMAENLPVIFLDTCILLDIIRAIKRRQANCVKDASRMLIAAMESPRQCNLVVSHVVKHEWGVHEQNLLTEANRHLMEIDKDVRHFHDACDVFGIVPGFVKANYAGEGVAERMHALARQLLVGSTVIEADNECSGKAMARVIHNLPPSKEGGEAKDCTILEECLAVCSRLSIANFDKKLVFCTSNTNDNRDSSGTLHANLAADFATVGLNFTSSLSMGFHIATH